MNISAFTTRKDLPICKIVMFISWNKWIFFNSNVDSLHVVYYYIHKIIFIIGYFKMRNDNVLI